MRVLSVIFMGLLAMLLLMGCGGGNGNDTGDDCVEAGNNCVELLYKYAPGDTLIYNVNQYMSTSGVGMTISLSIAQKVEQVQEDGVANIEASFEDFDIDLGSGNNSVLSSDMEQGLEEMKWRLRVASDGQVLESVVLGPGIGQFQQPFQEMMAQMVPFLPGRLVERGSKWTQVIEYPVDLPVDLFGISSNIKVETEYILQELANVQGRDVAEIGYTSKITQSGEANLMGQEFSIDGSGSGEGTIFFDNTRGIVVRSNSESEFTTEVSGGGVGVRLGSGATVSIELVESSAGDE